MSYKNVTALYGLLELQEIEPYWATPDPLNSLRYAFCEAAEAMDAWLRAERPSDSRNNERQNDVLDELADCAIMLLTAVS
jgi:NTP pyrophosphatase (non-canonical NTP hydrolase)